MTDCKHQYPGNTPEPFDRCRLDGAPCILSRLVNGRCEDYEPREEQHDADNTSSET